MKADQKQFSANHESSKKQFPTNISHTTAWLHLSNACITRLLSLLLLWLLPALAQAQFTYTTADGAITITGYTGPLTNVIIPDTIDGLPVIEIGLRAFSFNTSIASVRFPDTVTMVRPAAFAECRNLASVEFGPSITNIGEVAFENCVNLTQIIIPNSVISIDESAFAACRNATNLALGDSLISIGWSAFAGCESLTSVTVGDNVTTIGPLAFTDCFNLARLTIGSGVTNIGMWAFNSSAITNVTIPNKVTSIGGTAFGGCPNLTSLTFGNGLTFIGGFCCSPNVKEIYFAGNAPAIEGDLAKESTNNPVVYYLPGTTGWLPTFGSLPTELWKPQMDSRDANFGVHTNQFGFNVSWTSGMSVVVETCTNLTSPTWEPLQTNILASDSFYFSDPQWTNFPGRFYRLRSP